MNKILQEADEINIDESKLLINPLYINYIYNEANKNLVRGYRLYNFNQLLETFILFLRFTKLYEILCKHKHLINSNKKYLHLKQNFSKIIPILELIKPQLIKKYGYGNQDKTLVNLPSVPNSNYTNEKNINHNANIIIVNNNNDEQLKIQLTTELEQRWEKLVPKPKEINDVCNKNSAYQNVSVPIIKKQKFDNGSKPKSKTTDDIDINNYKFKYIKKDGTPLDALTILSLHLSNYNLLIKNVPGDNNCQFHAIADQLNQINIKDWNDITLRKKAVKWLNDNRDRPMDNGKIGKQTFLKDAVGIDDWEKYIDNMSKHNVTWGDEATLLAFSVLFKIEIIVISSLPNNYSHCIKPPEIWNIELKNKIYIGHYHEFHYVSTKLK